VDDGHNLQKQAQRIKQVEQDFHVKFFLPPEYTISCSGKITQLGEREKTSG
jgi:hypothetical protein